MKCLILLLLSILPREDVVRDRVDAIERNWFYDESGRLVFDQVIFYDWCRHTERFQCLAWRLVKSGSQIPERDWQHGGYVTAWDDGEVLRIVRSSSYRESWLQFDPEMVEREYVPKEQRRKLTHETQLPVNR